MPYWNTCRICKTKIHRGDVRAIYVNADNQNRYYCMVCWRKYYLFQSENKTMLTTHGGIRL